MVYEWAPRLSPSRVVDLIIDVYTEQYSPRSISRYRPEERIVLMLWGPPGVGKTDSVKKASKTIASILGRELVECSQITPKLFEKIIGDPSKYFVFCDIKLERYEYSDLIGLPNFRETGEGIHYTDWYPPKWVAVLGLPGVAGILFFDELTNAAPDAVKCAMEAIYEKKLGDIVFSDYVMIIGAGNPPEHSSVARNLPEPLMTRLAHLWVEVPVEEWIRWARENDVSREVIEYISENPGKLYIPWLNAVPRTWSILGKALRSERLSKWKETLSQALVGINPYEEKTLKEEVSEVIEAVDRLSLMFSRARSLKARIEVLWKIIKIVVEEMSLEYMEAAISRISRMLTETEQLFDLLYTLYSESCLGGDDEKCSLLLRFSEKIIDANITIKEW